LGEIAPVIVCTCVRLKLFAGSCGIVDVVVVVDGRVVLGAGAVDVVPIDAGSVAT
jgi:hypothetical protein